MITRPSLMWSTVRAMSACRFGLRYELQATSGPSSIREVASAQAASIDQHSRWLAIRLAVERGEVVPRVEDVVAELLAADGGGAEVAPVAVLRMELGGDPDRSRGCSWLRHARMLDLPPEGKSRYVCTMFPIGQFARLAGISAKQLRAYDALGLFRPAWVDRESRYRYYSPAQLPELRRILALRQLGMPLDEIGALVAGRRSAGRPRAAPGRPGARATTGRGAPRRSRHRRSARRTSSSARWRWSRSPSCASPATCRPPSTSSRATSATWAGGRIGLPARFPRSGRSSCRHRSCAGDRGDRVPPASRGTGCIGHPPRAIRRGGARSTGTAPGWRPPASAVGPLRTIYLQFGADADLRLPPGWMVERDADFVTELQQPVE